MTRWCKQSKQHRDGGEHYAQSPHRPCEQGCSAAAHPADYSMLFSCPFCHNPTLQHYRLRSVTTTVTKEKIQCELPRIPIPRTRVNKAFVYCIRARVPARSPQNQGGAARHSMRGVCWWDATRLPPLPAGVLLCAEQQRGIALTSPWPWQPAPAPRLPSQGVRVLPWRSERGVSQALGGLGPGRLGARGRRGWRGTGILPLRPAG